jgi:ribonuclease J
LPATSPVRLVPLGGLGEVGMNCLIVEDGEDRVVVDCGLLFPSTEAQLGVEVIAPDLSYLRSGPAPKAVLLTHAHEDHVGGLPWLLRAFPEVPIFGTRFTLAMVKEKLSEHGRSANLREIGPRNSSLAGKIGFEPLQVPHSIPDAVGFAIRTSAGMVVHTGDFKIDWSPIDGRLLDVRRFAELGEEGVSCLLSDSTNAEREGTSTSEREVGESLARIFAGPLARGRIAVAMFGSNIHRVQSVVKAALAVGRKVCLLGRSITQNVRLAMSMGFLKCPPDLFVDPEAADHFAPRELVILCTGAQGESRAALSRLALGEHPTVQLEKGDLVIFSSRQIPGSERSVGALINNLVRRGCRVLSPDGSELVHTSGHACQGELRMMIDLLRPKSFVPVHGEYRMLAAHARLAEGAGVAARACHVIEDGEVVEMRTGELATRSGEKVRSGRLYLDGRGAESGVGELLLRDRQQLADTGVVICLCVLDRKTGELIRPPEVFGKGVQGLDEARMALASAAANEAFEELAFKERTDQGSVEEALRRGVRSVWKKGSEKRPMVMPVVVEL